jgi:hypothetical protein
MALLLLLLAIEARTAGRSPALTRVWLLELFGTSSLAAYFWHEMLIYYEVRGFSVIRLAGGRCGWAGFAGWVGVLVAGTALLSWLTDKVYRRVDRRLGPRPVPGGGARSAPERGADGAHHVLLAGEAGEGLLRHHPSIHGHLEDAAASGNQLRLDAQCLLELGRRTGGPGKVTSAVAVGDRDHAPGWIIPARPGRTAYLWYGSPRSREKAR